MTKVGRNRPCSCGSGKKYKVCCLRRDEEAQRRATPEPPQRDSSSPDAISDEDFALLDTRSNRVIDLIRDGRLDEAEKAAEELLVRYPGFMDGHLRLAMVCEARDLTKEAAHHYRAAAACLDQDGEELRADFLAQAAKLDPPT